MGKLLGEAAEQHRQLYTAIFKDLAEGKTWTEVSTKHNRTITVIKNTIYRMTVSLGMIVRNEPNCPEVIKNKNLSIDDVKEDPEFWLRKFDEKQNQIRYQNADMYF